MLRDLGVPFRAVASDVDEELEGESAVWVADRNALMKLEAAVLPEDTVDGAFVLTTDTVVVLGEAIMGKPSSAEDAASMLMTLSGQTHQVVSGVALARARRPARSVGGAETPVLLDIRSACAVTDVTFFDLGEPDVAAYVSSGEWEGKAGAYAIQGIAGLFVSGIRGEYSNVVGLPLGLLGGMFQEHGFDLLRRAWL